MLAMGEIKLYTYGYTILIFLATTFATEKRDINLLETCCMRRIEKCPSSAQPALTGCCANPPSSNDSCDCCYVDEALNNLKAYTVDKNLWPNGTIPQAQINATVAELSSRNDYCEAKKTKDKGNEVWRWVDLTEFACWHMEHRDRCPDDYCKLATWPFCECCKNSIKRQPACWIRVSKTLAFYNIKINRKTQQTIYSFASICCLALGCKSRGKGSQCRTTNQWPFCACTTPNNKKELIDGSKDSKDYRYMACCARTVCPGDCCYTESPPYCQCCPCRPLSNITAVSNLKAVAKLKTAQCSKCKRPSGLPITSAVTGLPYWMDLTIFCCSVKNCDNKGCCSSNKSPFCQCCSTGMQPVFQGALDYRYRIGSWTGPSKPSCDVRVVPKGAMLVKIAEKTETCSTDPYDLIVLICCYSSGCDSGCAPKPPIDEYAACECGTK